MIIVFSFSAIAAQKPVRDLEPTVILISIDGFRADYLEKYKPKYLNKLAKSGTRARWMTPSFPSKTFPNHYTIATGLLPAHHGIVANNIYDPEFDAVFGLGKREEVQNKRWWGGEPIWVTAEKQGQRAAAFFFPGTETPIGGTLPSIWKSYDGEITNETRVDTLLTWFDLPVGQRPTMITAYFSDVDDAGHRYSPNSPKTRESVKYVDQMIGRLLSGLKKRKIRDDVNIILVSDHGMTSVPGKNMIVLDELFDTSEAERVFWVGEIIQIFPKPGMEDSIYNSIKAELPETAKVYKKNEIPERYKYRDNPRIAPILVLPDEGWILTTRERYEKAKKEGKLESISGSHGYDNELVSMRALFVGHGPAFKKKYIAEPFQNTEVYNLMCRILNLKPAPNDGNIDSVSGMLR